MSNILNLKRVKFFAIIVLAVALLATFGMVAVQKASANAHCSITSTLRVGSTGAQVACLQTAVGVSADGKFGPRTATAVMAWQSSVGLTADGVFGPRSLSAWMGSGSVSGNFPAGCNSAAGFSVITGLACTAIPGASGPCTGGALFHSATGASCTAGGTAPSGLTGGAGSITVDDLSTYSGEEVGEGQKDVKVLAFEVEADDESDVDVSSIKVELVQTDGDSSDDITDYIDTVSVWMGSTKVGEADASDFNENSDVYTKSISLNGAIVRAGATKVFVVAVSALNNLDSGDIDDDDFVADVLNVRFQDAEGVVTTEDTSGESLDKAFDFADFATANDVELEADLTNNNPSEGVVIGDSSDETEVLMLSYEFTADGSDINLESLEFDFTSDGADTDEVASELTLKWGSESKTESVPDVNGTNDHIAFDDLDIDIDEGDSMIFTVWATIKDVDGAPLVNGDTFTVALDVSETEATDESGEDLAGNDLTGSADGEIQHIFTEAPEVTYVSSSIVAVPNGDDPSESATATLVVKVKALGGTIYLNGDDETTAAKEGLGVAAVGADTLSAYDFVTSGDYTIFNSGADNEYYKITENKTMTITITATILQAAAATKLGGIALDEVLFGTDITDDTSRSANTMDWSDLLDSLKSGKITLVGAA